MKKLDIAKCLRLYAAPVLTILLGLILLVNPDSASALVAKVIAWVLVLLGVGLGLGAVLGQPINRISRILWAAVCLLLGLWLLGNPLVIAKVIGRVLGFVLILEGAGDVKQNLDAQGGKWNLTPSLLLAGATLLIGLILVLLPMSTSRIFFTICGIVLICVGVGELVDRYRHGNRLERGDSDIIDVEKL